jgi:hypothetical protein
MLAPPFALHRTELVLPRASEVHRKCLELLRRNVKAFNILKILTIPERFELPTLGLGKRCSITLRRSTTRCLRVALDTQSPCPTTKLRSDSGRLAERRGETKGRLFLSNYLN